MNFLKNKYDLNCTVESSVYKQNWKQVFSTSSISNSAGRNVGDITSYQSAMRRFNMVSDQSQFSEELFTDTNFISK